ncbi:MAG: crossover junction endodeoxyribonuclease RuvC [Candidatus Magasanikbacteria bacterium]|nr:crossover junction endodeoxyribonuclease RuvC [Candidatus Magasanikbacteria bacterium]
MPKSDQLTILGIDPGFADTGFGIITKRSSRLSAVTYGSIKTSAKTPMPQRLSQIYQEICELIKKYHPNIIVIEQLFFYKNITTAIAVGQARGVIMLATGQYQLTLKEVSPLHVKMALTGYGKASKSQIQQMVKLILKLKTIPKPDDAADALAVAICGSNINFKKYEFRNPQRLYSR